MYLTVRLSDGSWLTKVRVEDVESRGKRATLYQYLRLGDILWTRFGLATVQQLHPESGQITAEFPGGFRDPKDYCGRNEIHQELRRVLYGSKDCFDERKDELRWDKVSNGAIMVPTTVEDSDSQEEDECPTNRKKTKLGVQDALEKVPPLQCDKSRFVELDDSGIQPHVNEKQSIITSGPSADKLKCDYTRESMNDLKRSLERDPFSNFPESGKIQDSINELVNRKKTLEESKLVFTDGPSVVFGKRSELDDIPQTIRKSKSQSRVPRRKPTNDKEMKIIYDTDIQSVLSTEEIVQHLAQRPVVALEYDDIYLSSKYESKRDGPFMETWEEKRESNSDDLNGVNDDHSFSPESWEEFSQPDAVRMIDFPGQLI